MKIKKILISQPKPELERSPYFEIARNFGVEMHFRPFIQVEGIPSKEFRKNRIDILSYTAVIMTSKNAVDHYFRVCNEMRIIVPETMKYFCISEATAYYLQKYIQFRKRKIFFSHYSFADLVDIIRKKHKEEKFILPCADAPNDEYTDLLDKQSIRYVKAPLYKALYSNLTDINMKDYDMLVLFSSAGIASLFKSFPEFKQNHTLIAAFGDQTAKAVLQAGLNLHIHAPQPQAPSMAMALEQFLKGEKPAIWQPAVPAKKYVKKGAKKAVAPALPVKKETKKVITHAVPAKKEAKKVVTPSIPKKGKIAGKKTVPVKKQNYPKNIAKKAKPAVSTVNKKKVSTVNSKKQKKAIKMKPIKKTARHKHKK